MRIELVTVPCAQWVRMECTGENTAKAVQGHCYRAEEQGHKEVRLYMRTCDGKIVGYPKEDDNKKDRK